MSDLEFSDLGLPMCERCMQHWLRDRPRSANTYAYYTRFHTMGHHA